jgi:hypothetical protein
MALAKLSKTQKNSTDYTALYPKDGILHTTSVRTSNPTQNVLISKVKKQNDVGHIL